jgi:hypothetical protein
MRPRNLWKLTRREMLSRDGLAPGLTYYPYPFAMHLAQAWLRGANPFSAEELVGHGIVCAVSYATLCAFQAYSKRPTASMPGFNWRRGAPDL